MKNRQLADGLRKRQHDQGHHSWSLLRRMSDNDIIYDYTHCARCDGAFFKNTDAAVKAADTTAEFVDLVNMAIAAHTCTHSTQKDKN